jgi:hypothetical protein
VLGAVLATARVAAAFPTGVVFAPTGDARAFGSVNLFAFASLNYRAVDYYTGKQIGIRAGSTWVGADFGILPAFKYGGSFYFGGAEAGANLLTPDLWGIANVVPIFDAKITPLAEGVYYPAVGVGIIGPSSMPSQPFNYGYVSLTKTLQWGTHPYYGRVTAGVGSAFVPSSELYPACLTSGAPCAFRGSPPFADQNVSPLLGYESPAFGPLSFGVDYIGGTSIISSTNVMVSLRLLPGAYISTGAWFSNDRRDSVTHGNPADGLFLSMSVTTNLKAIFAPAPDVAAAAAAPVPAPAPEASAAPAPVPTPAPEAAPTPPAQ